MSGSERAGNLMGKEDLPFFPAGLHDREADLKGRHTPRARMADRPVEHHCIVKLFQLRAPRLALFRQGNILDAVVAVDVDAVLGLADVASLAGDDQDAQVIRDPRSALSPAAEERPLLRAADAHGVLVRVLIARAV